MKSIGSILKMVIDFITVDVWRIQARRLPKVKAMVLNHLRVVLVALRGFNEDKLQLRASALTFYSLLSIVPVAAMAFGIAKGFGFEKMLENQIVTQMAGQEEVMLQVTTFAKSLLDNTQGGLVAGIGIAMLFWTVIKVLGNIELSFNDIWGVKTPRTLGRKFSDYLSIMLICPILIISSSSATVFITTQIQNATSNVELLGPVVFLIFKMTPFVLYWVLFTFVYVFMPNTNVKISSALIAGVITGTIYQLAQWIYIDFQVGVSKYNAIYGSFAALPLFLVWVQLSWLIVLFGAKISFAHQNVDTYEFEPDCLKASHNFRRQTALRIMNIIIKNFLADKEPMEDYKIAHEMDAPIRLVRDIIFNLTRAGLLTEVCSGTKGVKTYQPAHDVSKITVKYVLDILDKQGANDVPVKDSDEQKKIEESLKMLGTAIDKSSGNVLLSTI
ncbi:MAG: YihY/virulence factor BrkB family protein [Candidatus Omnitrophica bacterium]|nr:YihY/virulence factor BrkB family protein [Candidatus Omnitrophota bacterium]